MGEREALACIWACERRHLYLYGRAFTLRTDHQALTALLSTSGTGHRPLRLHRWSDRLRQYNIDLKFTPGRDNVVADLLSRSAPPTPHHTHTHTDTDQVERGHCPDVTHTPPGRCIVTRTEGGIGTGPGPFSAPSLYSKWLASGGTRGAGSILQNKA